MRHKFARPPVAAVLVAALLLAAAPPAAADEGWRLRFGGFFGDSSSSVDRRAGESTFESETGMAGGALSGEYRFSPLLGIELGVMGGGGVDLRVQTRVAGRSFVSSDAMGFAAGCVGFNFHIRANRRPDFYVGPLVAFVSYSSIDVGTYRFGFPFGFPDGAVVGNRVVLSADDEVALGLGLGVDVPFGESRWFFHANAKYLDTEGRVSGMPSGGQAIANEAPFFIGLGAGYRF